MPLQNSMPAIRARYLLSLPCLVMNLTPYQLALAIEICLGAGVCACVAAR